MVPRRLARGHLRPRARVHGDGVDSLGLRHPRDLDRVQSGWSSQPPRILTVKGTRRAARMARRITRGWPGMSRMSAAPLPLAGDRRGPGSPCSGRRRRRPSPRSGRRPPRAPPGSFPRSCIARGRSGGVVRGRRDGVRESGQSTGGGVHLLGGREPAPALPRHQAEGRVGGARHGRPAAPSPRTSTPPMRIASIVTEDGGARKRARAQRQRPAPSGKRMSSGRGGPASGCGGRAPPRPRPAPSR